MDAFYAAMQRALPKHDDVPLLQYADGAGCRHAPSRRGGFPVAGADDVSDLPSGIEADDYSGLRPGRCSHHALLSRLRQSVHGVCTYDRESLDDLN